MYNQMHGHMRQFLTLASGAYELLNYIIILKTLVRV